MWQTPWGGLERVWIINCNLLVITDSLQVMRWLSGMAIPCRMSHPRQLRGKAFVNNNPLTFHSQGVYNIVQTTKGDSRLELIVSRPIADGGDDFLNLRRQRIAEQSSGLALPHSQSMTAAPSPFGSQRFNSRRAPSPLVLHAASGSLQGGNYCECLPT